MTAMMPEMEDVSDFINQTEITMHVLLIHENPCRSQDSQQGMVHWSCKIVNEDRFIVIYFSKGAEIRSWCQPPQIGDTIPLHVPRNRIHKPYDGPRPPFETSQEERTFVLCSQPEIPSLNEVLTVLARDICLVEQTGSFDTWAQAMNFQDNRTARGIFNIICQQRPDMIALLGEGAYHRLLYEIDRS